MPARGMCGFAAEPISRAPQQRSRADLAPTSRVDLAHLHRDSVAVHRTDVEDAVVPHALIEGYDYRALDRRRIVRHARDSAKLLWVQDVAVGRIARVIIATDRVGIPAW